MLFIGIEQNKSKIHPMGARQCAKYAFNYQLLHNKCKKTSSQKCTSIHSCPQKPQVSHCPHNQCFCYVATVTIKYFHTVVFSAHASAAIAAPGTDMTSCFCVCSCNHFQPCQPDKGNSILCLRLSARLIRKM
jgi:hypothetical protein